VGGFSEPALKSLQPTLTVVFSNGWDCFYEEHLSVSVDICFREKKESYPESGQSPFVGSGSPVEPLHSQTCPRPPAWARLNSPVGMKRVKVDISHIWIPPDPLLGQTYSLLFVNTVSEGSPDPWLAWSSAPPYRSPPANLGRRPGDLWASPPACSPDAAPPRPAPAAASPSGGTRVGVVGRPPAPGCWRSPSSSSCHSAGSAARLFRGRSKERKRGYRKTEIMGRRRGWFTFTATGWFIQMTTTLSLQPSVRLYKPLWKCHDVGYYELSTHIHCFTHHMLWNLIIWFIIKYCRQCTELKQSHCRLCTMLFSIHECKCDLRDVCKFTGQKAKKGIKRRYISIVGV